MDACNGAAEPKELVRVLGAGHVDLYDRVKRPSWGAVYALAVCAFALIASEFMPVSLLTPIASDLRITEGMAGRGIAISGVFAVLTSLFISGLAGGLDRKPLLLGLTMAMGASGAIVALAPNYVTYMLGRALIGVVVGGFWSLSAATAIQLVPSRQVPRALAVVNGGNALATVVAAPLGAYLGAVVGWRGAFLGLVPIALIALIWQWITLPSLPAAGRSPGGGQAFKPFLLLKRRGVAAGMLASSLLFMGQFSLFTYVRPFLETATGVHGGTISFILLVIGAAGFIGTVFIGRVLQWRFYQTLIGIPLLMAATALALVSLGGWSAAVVALLALWGLAGTAAPVGWWAWIARAFPRDAEAGGSLFVAVVQTSIALGSTLGGLVFDRYGYRSTFLMSAALLAASAVLAARTPRVPASAV
ncbi:Purine ribonucleoside efflux pump nepI [Achromobacter insolitus]|nr:Purine ribonucleoside efflux pump NepI [Achromobacter insolitus]VEG69440.1 Purine ribonucleoside efflux pump nepI [Achromobacter insolitus]